MNKTISTLTAIITIVVLAIIIFGGIFAYQYYWLPKIEKTLGIQSPLNSSEIQSTSEDSFIPESLFQDPSSSQPLITVLPLLSGVTVKNGSEIHVIWKTQGNVGNIGIGFCPQGQPMGSNDCTTNVSYDNTGSAMISLSG